MSPRSAFMQAAVRSTGPTSTPREAVEPQPAAQERGEEFLLRAPDDFHVHLRQGAAVANYVQDLAANFARALVMPNTVPPIATAQDVVRYRNEIEQGLQGAQSGSAAEFTPLLSFKLAPRHDAEEVAKLAAAGVSSGKLYPAGVTTNSEDGVTSIESIFPALEAMQEHDIVLCIHGEAPDAFCLDRETAFLRELETIVARFPRLRVVLEHLSTADAVRAVRELPPQVAATITVHHLLLTLDDLIGGELRPHHFCKPVVKTPADRTMLQEAVLSAEEKFFFGSDSAPHTRENKECDCGCAGLYTAPVALPLLAEFFERHIGQAGGDTEEGDHGAGNGNGNGHGTANGEVQVVTGRPRWVQALEAFVARFGSEFYQLPLNTGTLGLWREPWVVPAEYHGVVPFRAGEQLQFRAARHR